MSYQGDGTGGILGARGAAERLRNCWGSCCQRTTGELQARMQVQTISPHDFHTIPRPSPDHAWHAHLAQFHIICCLQEMHQPRIDKMLYHMTGADQARLGGQCAV